MYSYRKEGCIVSYSFFSVIFRCLKNVTSSSYKKPWYSEYFPEWKEWLEGAKKFKNQIKTLKPYHAGGLEWFSRRDRFLQIVFIIGVLIINYLYGDILIEKQYPHLKKFKDEKKINPE